MSLIMNQKNLIGGLVFGTTVFACLTGAISLAQAESSKQAVVLKSTQVNYAEVAPFVKMGAAWGDRSKGSHGTLGRFVPGASSPSHTHSVAYHGVVITGVMSNPFEGQTNPPKMLPGSYWYVPAGVTHVTSCISAEACTFYFHANGAFDFTPTKQ